MDLRVNQGADGPAGHGGVMSSGDDAGWEGCRDETDREEGSSLHMLTLNCSKQTIQQSRLLQPTTGQTAPPSVFSFRKHTANCNNNIDIQGSK